MKLGRIILVVFMITTYLMGFYYNNLYRRGNLFASDIALVLIISWFFLVYKRFIASKVAIIGLGAAFIQLLIGTLFQNNFAFILRDLKVFLYFFVPYYFYKVICSSSENIKTFLNTYVVIVFVSIVLNMNMFLTSGLKNIDSGIIQRTFGIGLGWGGIIPILLIVHTYKKIFIKLYGRLIYWMIMVCSLLCVALSFTRTIWILFILTFIIKVILVDSLNKKELPQKILTFILIIFISFIGFNQLNQSKNPVFIAIADRFSGISDQIDDPKSTLSYRIEDVRSSLYKATSPRIIIGYGFGDTRLPFGHRVGETEEDNSCENSFFYYLWKYGLLLTILLFYHIGKKLYSLYKGNIGQKTLSIYLFLSMVVGSMSGNLNSTYSLSSYALLFAVATYINNWGIDRSIKIESKSTNSKILYKAGIFDGYYY